jgi:hypothetical protein
MLKTNSCRKLTEINEFQSISKYIIILKKFKRKKVTRVKYLDKTSIFYYTILSPMVSCPAQREQDRHINSLLGIYKKLTDILKRYSPLKDIF